MSRATDRLRALVAGATPGPWEAASGRADAIIGPMGEDGWRIGIARYLADGDTALILAAARPEVVLALAALLGAIPDGWEFSSESEVWEVITNILSARDRLIALIDPPRGLPTNPEAIA